MKIQTRKYSPGPQISEIVEGYFSFSFDDPGNNCSPVQRCMPLGSMGLFIHTRGGRAFYIRNNETGFLPQASVVGIISEMVRWTIPSGTSLFCVMLRPEGMLRLFGSSLASCYNTCVDAEEFSDHVLHDIIAEIRNASSDAERVFRIENYLSGLLRRTANERNYVADSIRLIRNSSEELSIRELSNSVFVCERQLQRGFKTMLGLSPKQYQRIVRFHQAMKMAKDGNSSWSEIALELGYSDQSHFIRDCRAFTGEAPTRMFA